MTFDELMGKLKQIPGGYVYSGACSYQICFPLKNGGELRFMSSDEVEEGQSPYSIDLYGGELPPGITGIVNKTGEEV